MKPALLAVVGRKGAGKAAVLEALVGLLKEKGLRVGVIKHVAREDFEVDEPGKDTYGYRKRGAETVMLLGRKKRAVFSDLPEASGWKENLNYFEGFDLVFLEGYFTDEVPMLEVYKEEAGQPLLAGRKIFFAVCAEVPTRIQAPHFSFNALEELAHFIRISFLLPDAARPVLL